ncbi:hypothetical protein P171DRAFT_221413 [Karstenula rhodostoma CBS 690.94]|uniref:Uncharacterized protein n=1 Tax=Karstenula rhodostoma CBS 690.94 TaxID=1392251 RepID=A0A9P4PR63_9PLEO|nr:hypothetical protein P171DRAFT_221413 [Karstenula rhodostoma CBS 690.94]
MVRDEKASQIFPTWQETEKAAGCALRGVFGLYGQSVGGNFHASRLFISAKGRMGIAVDSTEIRDAIIVVAECEYPLMMRKGSECRWQLVSIWKEPCTGKR